MDWGTETARPLQLIGQQAYPNRWTPSSVRDPVSKKKAEEIANRIIKEDQLKGYNVRKESSYLNLTNNSGKIHLFPLDRRDEFLNPNY